MMKSKMMKPANKIRLFIVMAAVASFLGGCEKESNNTVENGPVSARITSAIIRQDTPDTRAAGTFWASGDAIGVSGTSGTVTYTNVKFVTTAGNGVFTADGGPGNDIYFMDQNDAEFTAYYPHSGTNGTRPGTDGTLQHTFTAADQTAAGQAKYDFLFARATGSSSNPNVQFFFNHCMSRIVLNFQPGNGVTSLDDIEYTLTGLTDAGTFNILTGLAKATSTVSTAGFTLSVPYNASGMSSSLIVFPQQSDAEMQMTLTLRGVTYKTSFYFPTNTKNNNVRELASGYSYIYNVKLNNTTITISPATIGEWGIGSSSNIDSHS